MNLIMLKEFFADYSLATIVIALIIAIAKIITDKFVDSVKAKRLLWYAPFILGVAFCYLYNLIFLKEYAFNENVVISGIISGGLSYGFAFIMRSIYAGKPLPANPALAVIQGLLDGYVVEDKVQEVTLIIYDLYLEFAVEDQKVAVDKITDTINGNSNGTLAGCEIVALSEAIVLALGSK